MVERAFLKSPWTSWLTKVCHSAKMCLPRPAYPHFQMIPQKGRLTCLVWDIRCCYCAEPILHSLWHYTPAVNRCSNADPGSIAAGIIPIPGAKSLTQLDDLIGALDWGLEENEVEMINEKLASMQWEWHFGASLSWWYKCLIWFSWYHHALWWYR